MVVDKDKGADCNVEIFIKGTQAWSMKTPFKYGSKALWILTAIARYLSLFHLSVGIWYWVPLVHVKKMVALSFYKPQKGVDQREEEQR